MIMTMTGLAQVLPWQDVESTVRGNARVQNLGKAVKSLSPCSWRRVWTETATRVVLGTGFLRRGFQSDTGTIRRVLHRQVDRVQYWWQGSGVRESGHGDCWGSGHLTSQWPELHSADNQDTIKSKSLVLWSPSLPWSWDIQQAKHDSQAAEGRQDYHRRCWYLRPQHRSSSRQTRIPQRHCL